MSKCREAWLANPQWSDSALCSEYEMWKAAWNARGKVDAEICRQLKMGFDMPRNGYSCAEAIEQEDEK